MLRCPRAITPPHHIDMHIVAHPRTIRIDDCHQDSWPAHSVVRSQHGLVGWDGPAAPLSPSRYSSPSPSVKELGERFFLVRHDRSLQGMIDHLRGRPKRSINRSYQQFSHTSHHSRRQALDRMPVGQPPPRLRRPSTHRLKVPDWSTPPRMLPPLYLRSIQQSHRYASDWPPPRRR